MSKKKQNKIRRKNINNYEVKDVKIIESNFLIRESGYLVEKMTSKEHAERIFKLGKERALSLLKMHKLSKNWNHVDWVHLENLIIENN